jgi:RND family efflux transporter MFP subunit
MTLRSVSGAASLMLSSAAMLAACASPKAESASSPPPRVAIVTVAEQDVPLSSEWIATLDGYVNAQVRPQVSGYLVRRTYHEGATVRKGQVLFEIDPRPFQAVLDQAIAQMMQADAQLSRAIRDVERDTPLAKEKAIAQGQLDTEVQAMLAAKAGLEAAKATVEMARLNLQFTRVTSLVDGVAAIASAQIGDLVGPTTLLTTVSQVEPIKAYFAVSEQEYLGIASRINNGRSGTQPWNASSGLSLILSDGRTYPVKGAFMAADREVDPKTGTIRLAAAFANPGNLLRPGQYGRVRTVTKTMAHALLVPERAISDLQGQHQVHVIGPDNKVQMRTVTLGERMNGQWIVTAGLKAGERVAADGAQFLRAGTLVTPTPFTPAKAEQAAKTERTE